MKTLLIAFLLAAPLLKAEIDIVTVTFDSIRAMKDKNGDSLDGRVKFIFKDEKTSAKAGELLTTRPLIRRSGDDEETLKDDCRQALLASFLRFQARALKDGAPMVINVKTAPAGGSTIISGNRNKCICLVKRKWVQGYLSGWLAD